MQLMERSAPDSTERDFDRILENVVLFAGSCGGGHDRWHRSNPRFHPGP